MIGLSGPDHLTKTDLETGGDYVNPINVQGDAYNRAVRFGRHNGDVPVQFDHPCPYHLNQGSFEGRFQLLEPLGIWPAFRLCRIR